MRRLGFLLIALTAAAPAAAQDTPPPVPTPPPLDCILMRGDPEEAAARPSPLDSLSFELAAGEVKICYGRPSVRGRDIFGDLLPYGELWRTGANEPTMIHTTVALSVAGVELHPGSYSLYTVPGEQEWQVVVNGSVTQWGHERYYTGDVAAQEIGRATVESATLEEPVETMTFRTEPAEGGVMLLLEWENTRVMIPITIID